MYSKIKIFKSKFFCKNCFERTLNISVEILLKTWFMCFTKNETKYVSQNKIIPSKKHLKLNKKLNKKNGETPKYIF